MYSNNPYSVLEVLRVFRKKQKIEPKRNIRT